jgi:hypothetical protein
MGLFGKKEQKEEIKKSSQSVNEIPELPKLPELPPMHNFSKEDENLPQLPTFPNNSLGNKFSQNTIKEAVAGKKEDEEVFDAEDFPEEHKGMMQKPLQKSFSKEYEDYEKSITEKPQKSFTAEYDEPEEDEEEEYERAIPAVTTKTKPKDFVQQDFAMKNYMTKKAEPVFIRIDKFEESMKIFQDIRFQISEIEKLIKNTKEIKAKEEEELGSWQTEIQSVKNQIEKVNQDIFSRIE